jgi:hypothetical protein
MFDVVRYQGKAFFDAVRANKQIRIRNGLTRIF